MCSVFLHAVLYICASCAVCICASCKMCICVICTVYLCVRRCVMCCMYLCVCCGFLRAPSPSGIKQVPHTGSGGTTTHRRTDITRRLACQKTNPTQEDPNWAFLGVHQRFFLKKIVTTSCGGQDQNNSSKKEIKYRDSRSNHKRDRDREPSSLGRRTRLLEWLHKKSEKIWSLRWLCCSSSFSVLPHKLLHNKVFQLDSLGKD